MKKQVLKVEKLKKVFSRDKASIIAAADVSFSIYEGECFGLIGESGSGKTTIASLIGGFLSCDMGEINFLGHDLINANRRQAREYRKDMQMVFQDPVASFNPKMKLVDSIGEGLRYYMDMPKQKRDEKAIEALSLVGLPESYANRKCYEISGGECQRAAIARAILIEPRLLICDEATSALDVSVQSQTIGLLDRLRRDRNLSYLFISHDLGLVSGICDRVAVMYHGQIVEMGGTMEIINSPLHPYTQMLISSVLLVDKDIPQKRFIRKIRENVITGPKACIYSSRCNKLNDTCLGNSMIKTSDNHWTTCNFKF